jgi:hypothetical protein
MHSTGLIVSDECQPHIKEDGRLYFSVPTVGEVYIFQKHTDYLDPSRVNGLDNDEVRQSRAWLYDLPLDADWETIIARTSDLGADGLVSGHDQVQIQREAQMFA